MTKFASFIQFLILVLLVVGNVALSAVFNQENLDTHLRWNLMVPKDAFFVSKDGSKVRLQTNNKDLFLDLSQNLKNLNLDKSYFSKVNVILSDSPQNSNAIEVELKDKTVELFSFYRDADKKHILDFWINTDVEIEKNPKISSVLPLPKKDPVKIDPQPSVNQEPTEDDKLSESTLPVIKISPSKDDKSNNLGVRDFRYGANFIWDYSPLIPDIEKDLHLVSKIPEYLYPIKDRENIDDPKEAHMQLSINFYKDEKWGLMNKSISLYESKYGRDSNLVMNEFLKANSLLRNNLVKPNRSIMQSAINLLSNVRDLTNDYELKAAIFRYMLQFNIDQKDYVKALELSKQLFVVARAEFDQTIVIQSALTMFHCLSELKQIDQIQELLNDKKLMSILPPQMGLAYKSYAMLSKGQTKDLIKEYLALEKSLVKPVHPAILFNIAESMFREAKYEQALKLFDEFTNTYSYLLKSPFARIRMALIYELMDKDFNQTKLLYKNAIDRSTSPEVRYEAKIRYVSLRNLRNLNPTKDDLETEVFLEQSPDETKAMTKNLKKSLWSLRLRLFIVKKEYENALAYLSSIPLDTFDPSERRVFEGDGAEIIFGLIQDAYLKEDYARVVKMWEIYKDKYETKVARNAYMNYIVSDSFLKLGLFKSYERAFETLKLAKKVEERTFPIWVERLGQSNFDQMIVELEISKVVANKDWKSLRDKLSSSPVSYRDSLNYNFYMGLLSFHEKNYEEAIKDFEKVFIEKNLQKVLTPRQVADLLMSYVESLYQLKNQNRFKTVVKALIQDIDQSKSAQILNVSERINYLLIETYAGESKEWSELENLTKDFNQKFQKSPYKSRVQYIYGLSLIKNMKLREGKEILTNLTNDGEVPSHIKEMCRSELTNLRLKEKNI